MKKKRILGILFSFALVLGLISAISLTTYAEDDVTEYPLWIGTTKVTSANMNDVFGDGIVSFTPTGEHSGTLKLKGYTGGGDYAGEADAYLDYTDYDGTLTIIASGSNTIHNTSQKTRQIGINSNGNLIIKGDGVLNVNGGGSIGDHASSTAISVYPSRYLSIQEKVTVIAQGGRTDINGDSRGIVCNTLNVDATVKASGGDYGIQSTGVYINDTGVLEALGSGRAIVGKVYNTLTGSGWNDAQGFGEQVDIPASDKGQELTFKKVLFPVIKCKATFRVVNGAWDDGTTVEKTVSLTSEGSLPKLSARDIPAVGNKPGSGYKEGSWDVTPTADSSITKDTTYTYTYAQEEKAVVKKDPTAVGTVRKIGAGTYVVKSGKTVYLKKITKSRKSFTVPAKVKIKGKTFYVTGINAKAFKGTKAKTLIVKTKKLTKKSVKGSLKGSKIKTVKVKVGKAKVNKKYVKRYKKIFTKKNAGRKVTVK